MFLGGDERYCIDVLRENWGLHIRRLGVCGYGYAWEISYPRQACQSLSPSLSLATWAQCPLVSMTFHEMCPFRPPSPNCAGCRYPCCQCWENSD